MDRYSQQTWQWKGSQGLPSYVVLTCCHHVQLSVGDILQPAIDLAENGYPVAPVTAHLWSLGSKSEPIAR